MPFFNTKRQQFFYNTLNVFSATWPTNPRNQTRSSFPRSPCSAENVVTPLAAAPVRRPFFGGALLQSVPSAEGPSGSSRS